MSTSSFPTGTTARSSALFPSGPRSAASLAETFRRLYFHLYSNSNISRAERIMDDLSLLLLSKLIQEKDASAKEALARFQYLPSTANETLLPPLRVHFPELVDDQRGFNLTDDLIRWAFGELDGVELTSAPAHVLGDAFQALIGPSLRGDRGQFFTPTSLVRAMVRIVDPQPHESVLDPACGTGGFLSEAHLHQSQHGSPSASQLVGIDKDPDLARFCMAILEIVTGGRAEVFRSNSLDELEWNSSVQSTRKGDLFDVILTNPPFGARIGIRDPDVLRQFAFGHRWSKERHSSEWFQTVDPVSSQHPQVLFLELCVRKLKPGGRLGIVLPEGMFGNKQQAYVWSWLRTQGHIFALLDCPRTTFQPSTDTKTNVLFFRKGDEDETAEPHHDSVRVGVAIHSGHDRRGRTHFADGTSRPDDFRSLGDQYHNANGGASAWQDVVLSNPEYVVPRYYMKREPLLAAEKEIVGTAPTATLRDLVLSDLLEIRKGHEPGADSYGTGSVPFIRTSDIINYELSADPSKGVSEDIYRRYSKQQQLQAGDILMAVDGRYRIGTTALITKNNYRCVVQSHFRILSPVAPSRLSSPELLFALNLPSVKSQIRNLVFVQSTLGTLGSRLYELRIPLLHGDGPWRERVDQFGYALQQRDQLLVDISKSSTAAYDL